MCAVRSYVWANGVRAVVVVRCGMPSTEHGRILACRDVRCLWSWTDLCVPAWIGEQWVVVRGPAEWRIRGLGVPRERRARARTSAGVFDREAQFPVCKCSSRYGEG